MGEEEPLVQVCACNLPHAILLESTHKLKTFYILKKSLLTAHIIFLATCFKGRINNSLKVTLSYSLFSFHVRILFQKCKKAMEESFQLLDGSPFCDRCAATKQ